MLRRLAGAALLASVAWAAGDGNQAAAALAARSPAVRSALALLERSAGRIADPVIRAATLDALRPSTCVAHRVGLTAADQAHILEKLIDAKYAQPGQRIFPPLADENLDCPKLPQPFGSAPGSTFGGHHSYPGGLAIHEAFNLSHSLGLGQIYRSIYGPELTLREDILIAAPIWHDWAKTIVFQWNADGAEFPETAIAGTPAHHILGLAETMTRNLPATLIVAQASAHGMNVADWIRAAAIIARVDPVARGYLDTGFLPESAIHNLSDADFVLSIPAVATAERVLKELAGEFGFDPADQGRYNTQYRNPALSFLTAERILFTHSHSGIAGVRLELKKLRAAKVI